MAVLSYSGGDIMSEISKQCIQAVTELCEIADLKETISADGQTITYQSDGNGYDNAQYTLT